MVKNGGISIPLLRIQYVSTKSKEHTCKKLQLLRTQLNIIYSLFNSSIQLSVVYLWIVANSHTSLCEVGPRMIEDKLAHTDIINTHSLETNST